MIKKKDKVFTNDTKRIKVFTNDRKRIKCSQIMKKGQSDHK